MSLVLRCSSALFGENMGQVIRHSMPIYAHVHYEARMQKGAQALKLWGGRLYLFLLQHNGGV